VLLTKGGAEARALLRDADAREALMFAARSPPGDPNCGAAWGVGDVHARLQVIAHL
jgi:hypothetical protein